MTLESFFYAYLWGMVILGVGIFITLQFITPAYGMTYNNRWGASISSRWGWLIMETPVFVIMFVIYINSLLTGVKPFNIVTFIFLLIFQTHYLQRSFIFPALMKGNSRMPLSIMFAGIFFNASNAFIQGGWLFMYAPADAYPISWFWSPQFIIGCVLFAAGMVINIKSDRIIRKLRKSRDDNNYYLPQGFLFKYINSSNYFGEIIEWVGFAVMTWSVPGLVFVIWSVANILPRAKAVYNRYTQFWGEEFTKLNRWKIFPFIY